jgi:hypothetical protein
MKNILLLSLFAIISFFKLTYSYDNVVSSLSLTLYDDEMFSASLDGVEIGINNYVEIDGLDEGRYFLKINKKNSQWNSNSSTIFSDYIFIPAGHRLYAVIDEQGNFIIYKKAKYELYTGHKEKHNYDICHCDCEACRTCLYKLSNPETGHKDECKYKSMKDKDFNDLLSTLKTLTFENSQLEVIKQALDNNVVNTSQVKQLIKLLTFETTKVEVAKYAYKNTCDKKNYFNIYDAFAFESSITEVKNFIDGK